MSLIGFKTNNNKEFTPDKTLSINNNPKILQAKFGDGYEQRARIGINSLNTTYSVTFSNRSIEDAYELCYFFDEVLGVTSFKFTLPQPTDDGYNTVDVVCDTYSKTLDYNNYNTVTATFRRVYN